MTKEAILNEFRDRFAIGWEFVGHEAVSEFLSSLLDRYALSVVEAYVPETFEAEPEVRELYQHYKRGFNSCRAQTLENARRLVAGGEKNM
jgi:hypothetical protein